MLDQFKRPWRIREYNDACFIVESASGQRLACFYYRADTTIYGTLTKAEAKECAQAFARLSREE